MKKKAQIAQLMSIGNLNIDKGPLSNTKYINSKINTLPLDTNIVNDSGLNSRRLDYIRNNGDNRALNEFEKMFKQGDSVPLMPDINILGTGSGAAGIDTKTNIWKTRLATEYGTQSKEDTPTIDQPIMKTDRKLVFAPGKDSMKINFNTLSRNNKGATISLKIGQNTIIGTHTGEQIVWSGDIKGITIDKSTNTITIPRTYQNENILISTENKNLKQAKQINYVGPGGDARNIEADIVEDVMIQTTVEGGRILLPNEQGAKDQIDNPFKAGSREITDEVKNKLNDAINNILHYGERTNARGIPLELNLITDKIAFINPKEAKTKYQAELSKNRRSIGEKLYQSGMEPSKLRKKVDGIIDSLQSVSKNITEQNTKTEPTKNDLEPQITNENKATETSPLQTTINQINQSQQKSLNNETINTKIQEQDQIDAQTLLTQIRLENILIKILEHPKFKKEIESGKFKLNIINTQTQDQRGISIKAPDGFSYTKG